VILADLPQIRVTFHRAFDAVRDPLSALDALRTLPQVDRVLTSGGVGDWRTRCEVLKKYAAHAGNTLTILAGAGIDDAALMVIASTGAVSEVHVGRATRDPQVRDAPVSVERVRKLRRIADGAAGGRTVC
jgi:copper homeostasis protein